MKLNINFDELVYAFEQSNVMRHYFIDTKENNLIYINEEIEMDASEKLEEKELLTASKCQKCSSKDIFWDY